MGAAIYPGSIDTSEIRAVITVKLTIRPSEE